MNRRLVLSLGVCALSLPLLAQEPRDCLNGLDPVLLAGGTEKPGLPSIAHVHEQFRYLFATEESKATFQKDSGRYAIQIGGGCARMGSLGGQGDPDRFVVNDGRIYIFASDQCREVFLKTPEAYLPKPELPPAANDAALARGRELLAKALEHHGGAAAWAKLSSFRLSRQFETKQGQQVWPREEIYTYQDQTHFRHDDHWLPNYKNALVLSGSEAFSRTTKTVEKISTYSKTDLEKEAFRVLPYLLIAAQDPKSRVAALGPTKIAELDVEQLAVSRPDMTTILGLDPKTHRVLAASWTGRGPNAKFGTNVETYDAFQEVQGLLFPSAWTRHFEGKPGATRSWSEIKVNVELDAALFKGSN